MDQGFKHFSHSHNLIMHQMPEGIKVSCSGCHSSATGTVYVCWQCNFFLHEQCYRATRSLKHPSHPPHPLALVPYPTYPSNSFYCNSCQIIGTGFSYSCADCDFDLHVQCAYSIPEGAGFKNSHPFQKPMQAPDHESFPHPSLTRTENHCIPANPVSSAQYHSTNQDPSIALAHDLDSVSITTSTEDLSNAQTRPFSDPVDPINPSAQEPSTPHNSTDLGCGGCKACKDCLQKSILETQAQRQRLEFMMELSRQRAQVIASCGAAMSKLYD